MKKVLLSLIFALTLGFVDAQTDLFFSEYIEGYANNKALEIYNPTKTPIQLSEYAVARFSNGNTQAPADRTIQLPSYMLQPYEAYVITVDLRDTSLWDSQFDKPVWNGYNLLDTIFDVVTGMPVTDSLGNVIIGPQYSQDGAALFGSEYNEQYDLQGRTDAFLCPDYDTNGTMYFNGNDAMALIKGTAVSTSGDNIVDVIGVIGENPEDTIMEDAWVDANGSWLTKNRTLVRKPDVFEGRKDINDIVFTQGGTFTGDEWISYRNNTFEFAGFHECNCATSNVEDINVTPIEIYPNPYTAGNLTISSDLEMVQIEIIDAQGRIVNSESLNNTTRTNINLENVDSGMYLARVRFANDSSTIEKVIIK